MSRYLIISFLLLALPVNAAEVMHAFSVAQNKQVTFSPGNLQYNAAKGTHLCADGTTQQGTWRFAEHQWDYVGDAENGTVYENGVKCDNSQISSAYDGWIDLFGWGTSGWNSGANAYQPWVTNPAGSDYYFGGDETVELTGSFAYADWSYYNEIGSDAPGTWRTLTAEESEYLFRVRPNAEQLFSFATVNDVQGVIILPDDWITPEGLSFVPSTAQGLSWRSDAGFFKNDDGDCFSHNIYSYAEWEKMENAGAVFFPAAGNRYGKRVRDAGGDGNYWLASSCKLASGYGACYIDFPPNSLYPNRHNQRFYGLSVRPVKKAVPVCVPTVSISGETEICQGDAATLTTEVTADCSLAKPLEYKWWFSTDNLSWTELPNTTAALSFTAVQEADSGWYKVAASGAGDIECLTCRGLSEPFLLNVQKCVPPCPDLHYATRDTTVCDTLMPFTWHGLLFSEPGTQTTIMQDDRGCDTLQTTWTLTIQTCCPDIQTFTLDSMVCDTLMPFIWLVDGEEVTFSDIGTAYLSVPHPIWTTCIAAEYTLRLDTVHCERLYDIIVNKYNWQLLCNNVRVRELFPEQTVVGYQWFKDGTAIPNATEDDYSEQSELHGEFQLRLHMNDGSYVWSKILSIQPAQAQAPSRIRIYHHNGYLFYQSEEEASIPSLPRGLYIIQIEQNGEQRIEKKLIP